MRYSSIVKWQYWTAIILLLVLSIHLIFRILPGSYEKSLEYNQVRENYGNNLYVATLIILLFAALFHGFNGLRVILYELSPRLGRIATPIILALGVVFAILGLLTIAGIYIFP
ncbi:MAG: hypothetical protein ACP5I7_01140 [Sulfolobales archaeon]|jgi:succinate dehydrogenase hydrophobic anchor subunit